MEYKVAIEELKQLNEELSYHRALDAILMWDQWISMPKSGGEYRQKVAGYMALKRADVINSEKAKNIAKYFMSYNIEDIENDIENALVRNFVNNFKRSINVPADLMRKFVEKVGASQAKWIEAVQKQDYSIFKPYLKEVFEFSKEIAVLSDPEKSPFEAMIEACDEGVSIDILTREFEKVKKGIVELLDKINKSSVNIDDSFLEQSFDENELLDFVKFIIEKTGYDKNKGSYGIVPHPFTNMFGPNDVRITLNCQSYKFGVFAAIHEAGHAMYAYRGNDEVNKANLWGGIMGGFHESQSRFYENLIGKSKEYWMYFYPEAQKRFKQFENVTIDEYYKAINKVQCSLKRILADEVTYSLHPIIRFELEKELFEGTIDFDSLPQAWNDKYYSYLGVRPENDAEGLMQDIHWAAGSMGYFQSYTLGNIYGGQIRHALLKAIPNVYEEISKGNFEPLNNWLTENIHQYSKCYTGPEIIKRITGEELNADYFIEYLNEKYSKIYNF